MILRWRHFLDRYARPTPLLGARIDALPYLSGYGLLGRLAHLNRWRPQDHLCDTGDSRVHMGALDWFHLEASGRVSRALEKAAGFEPRTISRCWSLDAWSPLPLAEHWSARRAPPRICEECAIFGYHTAIFQLPWIARCPWHDKKLSDTCPQCTLPLPRGGANCAPFTCVCGAQLFDRGRATVGMSEFPQEACEVFLQRYRRWCREERRGRRILIQPGTIAIEPLLRGLIDPPAGLAHAFTPRDTTHKVRRISPRSTGEYTNERCRDWLSVCDHGHAATVELSPRRHDALRRRAGRVLSRLETVACPTRFAKNSRWHGHRQDFFKVAYGHFSFAEPLQRATQIQLQRSLPLSLAHPALVVVFQRLINQLEREVDDSSATRPPRATLEARARRAQHHPALPSLVDALERLLVRAAVAGAFFFLVSHATARGRRLPERIVPVVGLRSDAAGAWAVTLVWHAPSLLPNATWRTGERPNCCVYQAHTKRRTA